MSKVFDLFIIGGGINGAGIARDASGRGLSVCLADKGEIGGATSSWSTKLIHGGQRDHSTALSFHASGVSEGQCSDCAQPGATRLLIALFQA